ncbi:MAG TPA: glycine cleavage system protein GcvH [Gammaproteobacteria bacterium]|jgi:glycine cleavage system H protein|nr:glycine cleavage system protein H [Acidiferrobacteraceae bacterium]MDP6398808.1 glycine cleavage system protein GcvH [Arenicellales bacterium]MDP6551198.1 glycine cleavage system protein GcvH [Arenicellales bacterium]MDP6918998.1 glycine cleavage system protein GcvH [Arenicellales bacterium]HCX88363.1 glycine cleavage system protein GcvH [Gammaproteobacteria bacterium]|tara:strand:+ start:5995 stop:6372 length:378 start_codon:yes stop_codon:yes gene_type:complete
MTDLKFTADHEWARLEGDVVTVGITDYAQDQLGELVYVELPEAGIDVSAGQEIVVIESVKAAGDVKSPVTGTVIEVNQALSDEPEKVNEDPTGAGWFYRIRVSSAADLDSLMDESAYQDLVSSLD